jgi:hypothetical protein
MPHVALLVPDHGVPGSVVEVEVFGTGLRQIVGLRVSGRGVVASVIRRSDARLVVALAIAEDAAAGPRAVVAVASGGEEAGAVLFHVRARGSGGGMMGIGAQLI